MLQLLPGPAVHAGLASAAAVSPPHEHRATARVKVALAECQSRADSQPRAPKHNDQAAQAPTCTLSPPARMAARICSTVRRVGRISHAVITRRATGMDAGHRGRRATTTSGIEWRLGHGPSFGAWVPPPERAPRAPARPAP